MDDSGKYAAGQGVRVLLTGADGRLGRALLRLHTDSKQVGRTAFDLLCPDKATLDLSRVADIRAWLAQHRPQCIVHTAAYTQVDAAEGNAAYAMAVNAIATQELARWAGACGASMLYISTDYVFDGGQHVPYQPYDAPRPLNVYGMSKWQGEQAVRAHCPRHWVLRSSWLHHDVATLQLAATGVPPCFAQTIWQRLLCEDPMRGVQVVSDQIGTPTTYGTLAQAVWRVLLSSGQGNGECSQHPSDALPATALGVGLDGGADMGLKAEVGCLSRLPLAFGTYHVAGAEVMSWYALAQRVADSAWQRGMIAQPVRVQAIRTAEWNDHLNQLGRPVAQRPAYSALACHAQLGK